MLNYEVRGGYDLRLVSGMAVIQACDEALFEVQVMDVNEAPQLASRTLENDKSSWILGQAL